MIGIFGGSFDPVHFGHIKPALALLEHYEFDQISFIPCKQSPLKNETLADENYRLEMLNIVAKSHEKLTVDDRELKREGPSYTIETLKELRAEIGESKTLVMLMGVDIYLSFCKWHKYDEILSYCHIMLLQRPGYSLPTEGCEFEIYHQHVTQDISKLSESDKGKIYLSDILKIDISSTSIRKTISNGEQPKYLLPGSVWSYIKRNNLYH